MSLIKYTIVNFAFALLLPPVVMAGSLPRFMWSDSKGFVQLDAACVAKTEEKVSISVAQKPGAGLNSYSKLKGRGFFTKLIPSNLLDRSILFVKSYEADNISASIQVVAVPKNATRASGIASTSKRGDEGTLSKDTLQEIGSFVIRVVTAPAMATTVPLFAPVPVRDTYWQAAMDDDKYMTVVCDSTQYTLFDVYDSKSINPVAQVALSGTQTAVFENVQVLTPDEANEDPIGEAPEEPTTPPTNGGGTPGGSVSNGGTTMPGTPGTNPGTPTDPSVPSTPDNGGGNPGLGYIVCTTAKKVTVLDKDLKPIGEAGQFEPIIPSQTWDEKQKSTHLEVQFPSRENDASGWLPRELVQTQADCAPYQKTHKGQKDDGVDLSVLPLDPSVSRKDCCKFPTASRPSETYAAGQTRFRAGRAGGRRLHAGVDLYRKKGEAAMAVASGTVIRGLYYFYQGVFAVEVKHPLFIARYGEVLGNAQKGILKGKNVVAGQTVGLIGKVNSGCCTPMLHFEMYKGTSHGPLTRYRSPPYDRRPDVFDPTSLLRQWEKSQFGKSY